MSIKKSLFPALLVCAVLALTLRLFARPASAQPVFDSGSYEEIDAYIEKQLDALNIPGASLAIIEGDQIVHVKGFGVSGPDGKGPTPQTPFMICSLTKSFTALAVMQLVEAGKIELDAPVQRYLPWFTLADPQATAQVTVRHLLNQTSGLTQTTGWKTLVNFDDSPDSTEKQVRETEDMAHHLIAQLNGGRYGDVQILSPEGIAEMHSPAAKFTLMGTDMGDYGMGWFIEQTSRGTLISHDGTAPDYFAYMALLPDQNRGMVLLLNANEFFINMAFKFVGGDAALVLAGGQPESIPWAAVPWSLRAFLIIPVLQVLGVFFTLRAVRRWRKDASRRPGPIRKWFHIGLPAIPNLVLVFCAL